MFMRVVAYCLEYRDGIELTQGVAAGNEPAVLIRDLTGRITAWIEVGMPDADRLHRGLKLAGRAAVYTHRDVQKLLAQLSSANIERLATVPVYEFDRAFVDEIAGLLERREIAVKAMLRPRSTTYRPRPRSWVPRPPVWRGPLSRSQATCSVPALSIRPPASAMPGALPRAAVPYPRPPRRISTSSRLTMELTW